MTKEASLDLIFDGQCGFCTRMAHFVQRIDSHHRIALHPYQGQGVLLRTGLTHEQAASASWAITETEKLSGAASINAVLDVAFGTKVFTKLYHLPGIRWAQDRLYRRIAEKRYALPGVTPWCESHPEDCPYAIPHGSCRL